MPGRHRGDDLSSLRTPGEIHLLNGGVVRDALPGGRPKTGDHIDDAIGDAGLLTQLGQLDRRGWGEFGRLNHHRVSGGQGWGELFGQDQQWVIPGRY